MNINAGMLDRKIEIYKRTGVKDSFGEEDYQNVLFSSGWAMRQDLETKKDNERLLDGLQRVAMGITQFTFRYRTDMSATMQLKDDEGNWFEIVGMPIIHGRRDFVTWNCEARNNA